MSTNRPPVSRTKKADVPPECKIASCGKPHHGKGYCRHHYRVYVEKSRPKIPVDRTKYKQPMPYYIFLERLLAEDRIAS